MLNTSVQPSSSRRLLTGILDDLHQSSSGRQNSYRMTNKKAGMTEDLRMSEDDARQLDSPLMTASVGDEIARLKSGALWASNGRAAITLMKTPHFRIVLIALGLGKIMREHRAEGPIALLVQQGAIRLTAAGAKHLLKPAGVLALDRVIAHEVEALEESTFLLTIVQPQDPRP
jgi:quercetin dioxygenase-like cupin family protein